MHLFSAYSTKMGKLNNSIITSFKTSSLIQKTMLQSTPPINAFASSTTRPFSQSTSIPKKLQRVRDHGYDNYMEVEKKMRKVLKFQDLILSLPSSMVSISRLDTLARRIGLKQFEAGRFILKFPHVFEIFEHPVQRILYCRLTRKALLQIDQEKEALLAQVPDAVTRLRKLIMLSSTGRLQLEHVRVAREERGLPDDFEFSVILKDLGRKSIEKGIDAENIRFSFIVNFPPGFKIGKYYKIAVWKWQRIPYWSPYDDISGYDLRSLEAQKRIEKRAVAMIHELLSLTVEKKITLERIAHFRLVMNLPKKLKEFLLQHQGIFYISTRGNQGKLHTVFLREAYKKGELIEPNDLYLARRKLAELILLSPRKVKVDRELVSYRRHGEDDEMGSVKRDCVENAFDDFETEDSVRHVGERKDDLRSDLLHYDDVSDYTDGDNDSEEGVDAGRR
ncbi:Protein ROOT PRIMORDIUM DEFECTIVE 1 [Camellia lanceoleosa]|uniref:Protein ROOT PRIMORDIUM DEFECTIVE 1 n=1 Tax=Camellia lanceoleosa TaxID=1840588 RepID=A0ACC0IWM8_9ERIC|nr:Protein ROOT PRIMORDIUM DEFECTIVE 1 [Camellia lanceoleosa]